MPPNKSGRPLPRTAVKSPATKSAKKTTKASAKPSVRSSAKSAPATSQSKKMPTRVSSGRPSRREPAGEVVLGNVPVASRMIGAVGILGGALLAVAVLVPELTVGEEEVVFGDSLATTLVSWIWPLTIIAAGVSVVLGRYPRLGLAALGVAGAVSVPGLVGALYWASPDAARGRYEIIAGRRLLTSSVEVRAGWYLGVAGLIVLMLVALAVSWVWARVVMDDSESLDPGRPLLGGLAAVTGVTAVLALSATLVVIPDEVSVSQQIIAGEMRPVETAVPVEGAIGLLGRPGLALSAGLLLAAVLVLFSMFATTLRPRLAVVGALGAFTGYVLGLAARTLVDGARSEQIEVSVGGWGIVVVAAAYAGLTLLARRWNPPVRAVSRGLPMRPASRRALKKG